MHKMGSKTGVILKSKVFKRSRVRRSYIDQSASADSGEWDHLNPAELANISTVIMTKICIGQVPLYIDTEFPSLPRQSKISIDDRYLYRIWISSRGWPYLGEGTKLQIDTAVSRSVRQNRGVGRDTSK